MRSGEYPFPHLSRNPKLIDHQVLPRGQQPTSDSTIHGEDISDFEDIPVVVIATKKDEFEGIKERELRMSYKNEGKQATLDQMDAYADNQLQIRLEKLEEEIAAIECGRFDLCVAVSKGKVPYPPRPSKFHSH